MTLANEAGARVVPTSYDAAMLLGPGWGREIDPDLRPAERILRRALAATERLERDMSGDAGAGGFKRLVGRATRICGGLVLYLVNSKLEQEYGSPARLLSAWYGRKPRNSTARMCCFPKGSIRSRHIWRGDWTSACQPR